VLRDGATVRLKLDTIAVFCWSAKALAERRTLA
jgi:hypothetical protein